MSPSTIRRLNETFAADFNTKVQKPEIEKSSSLTEKIKQTASSIFSNYPHFILGALVGGFVIIPLNIIVTQAIYYILNLNPNIPPNKLIHSLLFQAPLPVKVLLISFITIIAPLLEEKLFRGEIRNYFASEKDSSFKAKTLTVLKTALIFGLFHIESLSPTNLPLVAATTVMGIIFGILREYTGNLSACTGAHMANNIVAVASWYL